MRDDLMKKKPHQFKRPKKKRDLFLHDHYFIYFFTKKKTLLL